MRDYFESTPLNLATFFVSNLSPSYQTLQQLGTKENFGFNLVFYFYSLIKILYLSQLECDAFFLEGFT